MTVLLGLTTVAQKKNLVPVVKEEDFKMPFEKQIAKVCHNALNIVCEMWSVGFGCDLVWNSFIYMNVNNYLAEGSKIKQKGLFVEKPELGNSVDYLIIPKALKAYYIDDE